MKKDKKGRQVIYSLYELPDALRKDLIETRRAVGIAVFLIYLIGFVWLQLFPDFWYVPSMISIYMAVVLHVVECGCLLIPGFLLAVLSMQIAHSRILSREGYVLRGRADYYANNGMQPPFSEVPWNNTMPSQHSSHMSINTGSGLPMCGSSGMDVRGNPSGSSSW